MPEIDPLAYFLALQRDHGDMVRIDDGVAPWYLVAHPDYVEHVLRDPDRRYEKSLASNNTLKALLGDGLLTSGGETWARQRRLTQPAFQRPRIEARCGAILAATRRMLERWEAVREQGTGIDLDAELVRLTIEIVGQALFGVDLGERSAWIGEAMTAAVDQVSPHQRAADGTAERRIAELGELAGEILARRRATTPAGGADDDALGMLLSQGASERELRDAVLTLLFTGYETCSKVLAWVWVLLAGAPAVERRLRAELDAVLGGRLPGVADLPRLKFTEQILDETLRLYPPVWSFGRRPLADDEIGGQPVPAGALVVLSPYVTHRHPGFWPDPERFDPDRFAPERAAGRHRFAHFPFGGGQRQCIAAQLAILEGQIILAGVAQRFTLRLSPDHPVEPEAAATLRPRNGVWVTLHEPA